MLIDAQTCRHLEVFSSSSSAGTTVLAVVDRTRTRAGRDQLRRFIAEPSHSPETIRDLQLTQQILVADSIHYRTSIDRADLDAVDHYLDSNWQMPAHRPWLTEATLRVWRLAWYRQYLLEVARGQTKVLVLLDAITELNERLCMSEAATLKDMAAAMEAQLDSPHARELRRLALRRSTSARLAFDQLARGEAKGMLKEFVNCMGALEAWWSLAVATAEHRWSYPRPASCLSVKGLVHPFLGQQATTNDLHLDERTRVCFVTGPNMAGKSTFLKALSVAMLLAHMGCGVPAASMDFPVVATVFSSINLVDNLSGGESLYLAEVRRMRTFALALQAYRSGIGLLDEPFHGTNVHDASEATLAVVSRLVDHPGVLVFIASHLVEIVPRLVGDARVRLLHFAADAVGEQPRFDYRLRDGSCAQRLGMMLLRQEGVLELLERAAGSYNLNAENPKIP